MPVVGGQDFTIDRSLSPDWKPDTEVWRCRSTGEAFLSYNELIERLSLVRSRVFASGFTGKTGLTFEEAQREDEAAQQALAKLEESALRIIHNTYATISELVERVYAAHRPGKENAQDGTAQTSRPKHPMTRPLIRSWLFQVGLDMKLEGRQLWRAKPEYVAKYSLDSPQASQLAVAPLPPSLSPASPGQVPGTDPPKANLQLEGQDADAVAIAPHVPPPAHTMEEDELRLRKAANPLKLAAFNLLKGAGTHGMRLADIINACKSQPELAAGWDTNKTRYLRNAISQDRAFVRVAHGTFALRSVAGNVDFLEPAAGAEPRGPHAAKKRKLDSTLPAPPQLPPSTSAAQLAPGPAAPLAPPSPRPPAPSPAASLPSQAPSSAGKPAHSPRPRPPKPAAPSLILEDPASRFAELVQQMGVQASDPQRASDLSLEATKLLFSHREARQQAEIALERARDKAKAAGTPSKKKTPPKAAQLQEGEMPSFDLPEDAREYHGDPDDRKALMAHRKSVADREKALAKQKAQWLAAREKAAAKAASKAAAKSPSAKAAQVVKKAEGVLQVAAANAARAESGAAEVLQTLQRVLAAERLAAEKAASQAARAADRERKAQEAADAKRYPIEDLELLRELKDKAAAGGLPPPLEDVPLPEMLGADESEALSTNLYVSDFITQFATVLGVQQPLSFLQLHGLLDSSSAASGPDNARAPLWVVFRSLLTFILQSGKRDMRMRKLKGVLGPGTWPEVMLRYVLGHGASGRASLRSMQASLAAGMLEREPADGLAPGHLRALLAFLCDEALDAEGLREALAGRLDSAEEARAAMRRATAEEKRRLNEVLAQEKQERRQKREAEAQRREEEAAMVAATAAAQLAAERGEQPPDNGSAATSASAPLQPAKRAGKGAPALAEEDSDEEEEPAFELPEELKEWSGDPSDRKGMLLFRQEQQAARQALEKERAKWQKGAAERAKVREAARRARAGVEKARAKEKQSAERALMQQRQAYEKEVSALAVRAEPLGLDRQRRRYWWGLGAQRGCLFVEDPDTGLVGAWTTPREVEALMQALDKRGVREVKLLAELSKAKDAMSLAMKGATPEVQKATSTPEKEAAQNAVRRYGQRERTQVVLYSPGREGAQSASAAAKTAGASPGSKAAKPSLEEEDVGGGLEGAAARAVRASLTSLQQDAAKAGLDPTGEAGSWQGVLDALQTACDMLAQASTSAVDEEASPRAGGQSTAQGNARALLKQQLLAMEATVSAALTAQEAAAETPDEDKKDKEQEEEEGEEGGSSSDGSESGSASEEEDGTDSREGSAQAKGGLWPTEADQSAWQRDAGQAGTIARLAFCAALLADRSRRPLQRLAEQHEERLAIEAAEAEEKAKQAAAEAKKAAAAEAKRVREEKAAEARRAREAAAAEAKQAKEAAAAEARKAKEAASEAKQSKEAEARKKAKEEQARKAKEEAEAKRPKNAGPKPAKAAPAAKRKGNEKPAQPAKRTRSTR